MPSKLFPPADVWKCSNVQETDVISTIVSVVSQSFGVHGFHEQVVRFWAVNQLVIPGKIPLRMIYISERMQHPLSGVYTIISIWCQICHLPFSKIQ